MKLPKESALTVVPWLSGMGDLLNLPLTTAFVFAIKG